MSIDAAPAAGLLTQAEIALLASVRRPVVSVWRRRYVTAPHPFPTPAAALDGVDRFALAVSRWV